MVLEDNMVGTYMALKRKLTRDQLPAAMREIYDTMQADAAGPHLDIMQHGRRLEANEIFDTSCVISGIVGKAEAGPKRLPIG